MQAAKNRDRDDSRRQWRQCLHCVGTFAVAYDHRRLVMSIMLVLLVAPAELDDAAGYVAALTVLALYGLARLGVAIGRGC